MTRVGRSVRIPVDAYRAPSLPSPPGAASGIAGRPPASRRAGEAAADHVTGRLPATWPDTPERLAEQRRHAAALMERLAARGRPASGPSETADAILDAVREEPGVAGGPQPPGAERTRRADAEPAGRPGAELAGRVGAKRAGRVGAGGPGARRPGRHPAP